MVFFFPLEALGELHEDHLHLETQTHPKLIAVCVLFLMLVSELCVCSTKNSVRVITACTPWKHNRTITPPASCLWHCFFPRNNSGNTGTPKKLSIYRNRGQNYYLWGRHFMATVRNKMSQQQEELGPADTEDELGAFSTKGILGKQAGGGKKTLGEKSERMLWC